MGVGHAHALFVHGDSALHRAPAECKVAATALFVIAVVATPREAFWAFALGLAVVLVMAGLGGLGPLTVARRLVIEVPFVAFALLLPLIGQGDRMNVLGLSLSIEGTWAAWNILAKATIGTAAGIVLAATTPAPDLLAGLERLRVPRLFTSVAGFMVRYLDVVGGEVQRMTIARRSRGHDPRWLGQARATATSAGTLFIRSFERGERVYVSMLARGYDGSIPQLDAHRATAGDWLRAAVAPAPATTAALMAWTVWR